MPAYFLGMAAGSFSWTASVSCNGFAAVPKRNARALGAASPPGGNQVDGLPPARVDGLAPVPVHGRPARLYESSVRNEVDDLLLARVQMTRSLSRNEIFVCRECFALSLGAEAECDKFKEVRNFFNFASTDGGRPFDVWPPLS